MREIGWSEPTADETWSPRKGGNAEKILNRALEHIQSIPYKPSARWVFYRLWNEGYLDCWGKGKTGGPKKKRCNATFNQNTSRARHSGYWPPDILLDDTRESIGWFYDDPLDEFERRIEEGPAPKINPWQEYEHHIMIAFEARAMIEQFRFWCEPYHIRLFPLGGMSSIPFKYSIAEEIDQIDQEVIILYFGDFDLHGEIIGESAIRHIRKWATNPFKAYWAGLTQEQADQYNLDVHEWTAKKDGKRVKMTGYQWEALQHEEAGEIIKNALDRYCDVHHIQELQAEAECQVDEFRDRLL